MPSTSRAWSRRARWSPSWSAPLRPGASTAKREQAAVATTEIAANAATETTMFKRADADSRRAVTIHVEGRAVAAREGDTVSAALLASGLDVRRSTAVSGAKRLPYCMMGVCFDCLVTIDGVGNRQGCLVPVTDGMQIEIQKGKREIGR